MVPFSFRDYIIRVVRAWASACSLHMWVGSISRQAASGSGTSRNYMLCWRNKKGVIKWSICYSFLLVQQIAVYTNKCWLYHKQDHRSPLCDRLHKFMKSHFGSYFNRDCGIVYGSGKSSGKSVGHTDFPLKIKQTLFYRRLCRSPGKRWKSK